MLQPLDCAWDHISKMTNKRGVHPRDILDLARQTFDSDLDQSKQVLSRFASRYNFLVARLQFLEDCPQKSTATTTAPSSHASQLIGSESETRQLFQLLPAEPELRIAGRLSVTVYDTSVRSEQYTQTSSSHPAGLVDKLKRQNTKYLGLGLSWKRKYEVLEQHLKSILESRVAGLKELRDARDGRGMHEQLT
jgi:hypothetical protein